MIVVADENMPGLEEALGKEPFTLRRYPGRQIDADMLADADVLLVRSVTRVDAALLARNDGRLRFVGTATIGRDHLDEDLLRRRGVQVVSAPGCNAQAVLEYVLAALCLLQTLQGLDWRRQTFAVVGLGQVGQRVAALATALGCRVVYCDPAVDDRRWPRLSWRELLEQAQLLSLHVPLTRTGDHPTWHMLDAAALAHLAPGGVLISTCRGGVVDEAALRASLTTGHLAHAVLDVWEGEPAIDARTLALARLATPHVAGYSQEGKWRGSLQVLQALFRSLGEDCPVQMPPSPCIDLGELQGEHVLARAMLRIVPLLRDDAALRALTAGDGAGFDALRRHYPWRHEASAYRLDTSDHQAATILRQLGVQVGPLLS